MKFDVVGPKRYLKYPYVDVLVAGGDDFGDLGLIVVSWKWYHWRELVEPVRVVKLAPLADTEYQSASHLKLKVVGDLLPLLPKHSAKMGGVTPSLAEIRAWGLRGWPCRGGQRIMGVVRERRGGNLMAG